MDRSITPRISQLPQSQVSPHRTPTSKHDALLPEAEAGELSKAAASPGLLSWMRAALQLGPAGQTAQQQQQLQQQHQQQSRTDIASTPSSLPTIVDSPPSSAGQGTVSSRGSSSRRIQRRTSLQSAASRPRSSVSRDSQYSLYDDSEASDEDDSADEETFAPFAPAPAAAAAAAGPPALVRPTARRDAAFVRESSDGSLGDGQVLLDGAPAPAGRAALPPSASAQRISFGAAATAVVGGNELKVHEAQEDGQFVRDTTASAPSLVLTPPDEGSLEQQTSPLAGWVESDRFEPTPTPSSAHRAGRRVSIASTASGLTEREEEEAAAAATDERGDGETLDEFTQRPRSPAEMNKERQSREKVVLGTRGASLREQAGQQEARRARREQRRVEKEKEQMEVLAPVEAEWDESRSKTPKAFSPATMGTPRTASASTAGAGETTPLQTSKRNEPATPITASSALDVQTTTPTLNAPSPRRARLSFFGRKREASISSLLAPGSSPEHSRPSSSAATSSSANETDEDEAGRTNATPVAAAAVGRRTESESSAMHSQCYDVPPASAPAHAHAKAQSSGGAGGGAGFWRLGRSTSVSKCRGEAARPATASSSSLSTSFAHAQRSGAENLSVSSTSDAASSRRNSLANTDDAQSLRSSTSRTRPRPLSNAGSIDCAQSLKSAKLKASARKEKVPLPLEAPRAQKVRARNKPSKARDFGRLFLVQELQLGANSPQGGVGEVRRDSLPARQSSEVGGQQAPMQKPPPLLHSDSTSSITSNVSSVASSTRASVTSASSTSTAPPPSATGSTFASSTSGTGTASATYAKRRATWAMKFSVDGKYLAVAGQDAVVRVYQVLDSAVARAREVTQARARYETAAAQANEGLFPASGGRGGGSTSSLGSAAGTGSAPSSMRGKPSTGATGAAASSPLPNLSVFASEPVREFRGHTNDVLDLSWSKGGFLLSASMDKTARLWHLSSPTSLVSFVHGDFVTSACFHPRDDRFMLTGSLDGKLRLWNIPGKRVQYSQEIPGLITACSFTQSGATACVGTFAGAALFYSTDGLAYSSSIAVRSPSGKNAKGGRKITGIEPLASDGAAGERVLITSNDSRIRAYNLRDKSMSARWKAGKTYINRTSQIRASVADDGTYVVSGSECGNEGGLVHVWDVGQQAGDARSPSAAFKAGKAGLTQADSVCEFWTAAAGTVTCAIMAPLKTNAILRDADDPILMHAAMRNAGRVSSSTTQALSAMSLASAFSAAVPNSLKSGASASDIGPGFHPRECRIIASVDESAVVRIWRQDTHGAIP